MSTQFWPNWPIMNCTCLQGNANGTYLDPANHSIFADKDLAVVQSFYPTPPRLQQRNENIDTIHAQQTPPMDTKFFMYLVPNVTFKVMPEETCNNEKEINLALILDPVKGNPNWIVHRVGQPGDAGCCEDQYEPDSTYEVNITTVAGCNSLGENYATAYWKEWDERLHIGADDFRSRIAGFFHDVCNQRPADLSQDNGKTQVTDPDYDGDGVADLREVYSEGPGGGGCMWAAGGLETKARCEAQFPGKYMLPNAARWDYDYIDGLGCPTPPLTNAPFYRQWELTLDEHTNNNLGLRINDDETGYEFTGGGSISSFFRGYTIQEHFLKLDADIPADIGHGAVLCHANGIDRPPQSDDYEFARFVSLLCLLVERAAPCVQLQGRRPLSLDELLVELGAPLAPRSMGVLNEDNVKDFEQREPDQVNGVAEFCCAEFEGGMVLARVDPPTVGPWPSDDAAVECILPPPPAGKKRQRIDAANYKNPKTQRAMRGQDTTLNNGADVTSVALKPWHATALLTVDAGGEPPDPPNPPEEATFECDIEGHFTVTMRPVS